MSKLIAIALTCAFDRGMRSRVIAESDNLSDIIAAVEDCARRNNLHTDRSNLVSLAINGETGKTIIRVYTNAWGTFPDVDWAAEISAGAEQNARIAAAFVPGRDYTSQGGTETADPQPIEA